MLQRLPLARGSKSLLTADGSEHTKGADGHPGVCAGLPTRPPLGGGAIAADLACGPGPSPLHREPTVQVLSAWRDWQQTEQTVVGVKPSSWVFTNATGEPIHPHSISQTVERIVKRADVPRIRLHDLRRTHGTLLIKAGIPVKVVSERLGHGNPAFAIDTYQHVLPGMQAEAAGVFEKLIVPEASTG